MKSIRIYIELSITLFFQLGLIFSIYYSNWSMDFQMILHLQRCPGGSCQIFINGKEQSLYSRISSSKQVETLVFNLPKKKIDRIWLRAPLSGKVTIDRMIFKSILRKFEFKGKTIKNIFSIDKNTSNLGSSLEFNRKIIKMINEARRDKTMFYLLSFLASILFFCIFHFFNPRGILFFFKASVAYDVTLLFLIIIFFFLLDHLFLLSPRTHLVEKRKIAEKPCFRFDSAFLFPQQYTNYYNDFFPFRSHFIYLNNFIKVKYFGISPTSKVIIGKHGWLYMARESDKINAIDYYRRLKSFSKEELEEWRNLLHQRQQWLAQKNILYLFVPVPNKSTIYPEFMPQHIMPIGKQSLLDQLKEYLKIHSTVPVLDLREALSAAKIHHPVYSKTDTHWNDYGAYIAYREILIHISSRFKEVKPIPLSRFEIIRENRSGGDLAIMLSLHEEVMREDMVSLNALPSLTAYGVRMKNISKYVKQGYTKCKAGASLKVIMVHDSFYKKLKPYLSEQFVKVLYIWDWKLNFYTDIIQREKPAIVIDQMAERFLLGDIPSNPKLLWQEKK